MKLSRRSVAVGLGALATGSGATFSAGAFNNSTDSASDMRVVVDEGLEVRAGQAFNDDGSVRDPHPNNGDSDNYVPYDSNSSFFDPGPSGGLEDIDADDLPVATVNRRDQNVNGDVKIQVATDVDTTSVRFYDILEIVNNSADRVEVGIKYEDDQYGDHVDVGGSTADNINERTVQHVYRFIGHGQNITGRISPDETVPGNAPNTVVEIKSGERIPVDLKIDLSNLFGLTDDDYDAQENIKEEANPTGNLFNGRIDTVDLLDEITVVGNKI